MSATRRYAMWPNQSQGQDLRGLKLAKMVDFEVYLIH